MEMGRSAINRRFEVFLAVAVVVALGLYARIAYIPTFGERHVEVAEEKYGIEVGDPSKWFSAWSLGDGQAYAMLAVDPSGRVLDDNVAEAGYRYARIGYPMTIWLVSAGRSSLVPYAMALVGTVSVLGVAIVAIRFRGRLGVRAYLLLLNPALYIGFAGDTSEPLGVLLLVIAMATGAWWASCLIGITRPTYLIGLWGKWRPLIAGVAAAGVVAFYSLVAFGLEEMIPAGGRLGFPFAGYLDDPSMWTLSLCVLAAATVMVGLRRRDWSWVLSGLFVLSFGPDVVADPVNAWRAAGLLPVLWAFGTHNSERQRPKDPPSNIAIPTAAANPRTGIL
jgi:hypothetical protein